jgi:UDP-glucose 4-epimerase
MPGEDVALVTGGGGFIGSHLVERLCRDGHRVRVLDNFATGRRENLAHLTDRIELIEGDIRSFEQVRGAMGGADRVFHFAALPSVPRSVQDPLASNESNITGTLNVLLAARDEGVRRVVFASSSSVYGANSELPKREEMPARPVAPYAVAKLGAEGYCRAFFEVYGLETVSLRFFNVFGPRQDPRSEYAAVIPSFIAALLEGRPPVLYGDGEQSRDFTYVDNAVEASLLAAAAPGVAGETFNVACGERTTLYQLLGILGELSGRAAEAKYVAPRPGDVKHSLADISLARLKLGYEAKVDVRRGLELTYRHLAASPSAGEAQAFSIKSAPNVYSFRPLVRRASSGEN